MPKKSKKGKGKGKKGKKGGKKTKKTESVVATAAANSKVWETRLDLAEKAKVEFRDNAKQLMLENDALQTRMVQTEQDTIDVITYLKKQDQDKDSQLERIQQQMRDLKKDQRKEKEAIVEDFSRQVNDLEERVTDKTREVELMQSELKMVKEFRRKRGQMQKDLDEIKEAMHTANREHKATLSRMEQKFFEEKMRLQQEANQKIAELADKAHTEAITNLDETTKSVYKENVRLTEALTYHMKEGEVLKAEREKLLSQLEELHGEKEVNMMMVQNKVVQAKQQKEDIKKLTEKVQTLEVSLSYVVQEFETEKKSIVRLSDTENKSAKVEIVKLQRVIEIKTKEMNKVKRLAKNILDQRTELERFFLESLENVRNEIAATQSQYRHDAHNAYQHRMLAAHAGKGDYPKIRTFNKSGSSTNSVFKDLEAADRLYDESGKVDIKDLTWEQKEKVLRYLFAKMNGTTMPPKPMNLPPVHRGSQLSITQVEGAGQGEEEDQTFLTQAQMDIPETINPHSLVPDITAHGTLVQSEAS